MGRKGKTRVNLPPARGKVSSRGMMDLYFALARMRASRRGLWGGVHWEGTVTLRARDPSDGS